MKSPDPLSPTPKRVWAKRRQANLALHRAIVVGIAAARKNGDEAQFHRQLENNARPP